MMTRKYLCYLTTAAVVSFLPLPLILGGLFPLMKVLPPAFFRPAAVVIILAMPSACGWLLAARAHFPPTFAAKFLPLLLPPLLALGTALCCLLFFPIDIPLAMYALGGAIFLPLYALFLLAFCLRNRTREPARERRKGMLRLFLPLAVLCVATGLAWQSVRDRTLSGDDVVPLLDWEFAERYSPHRADNALTLPATPPSLRLVGDLPRLDGTLAALPLYAAAFQALTCLDEDGRPLGDEARFEAEIAVGWQRGDMRGLEGLADGDTDIFFGPPPSRRQLDAWRAQGLTPDVRPLAHEALVFFVQKDNPVSSLSREQLRRIYTGEITNWKEVGGRDERILPFQHEKNNENQDMLARFILRGETPLPALREELRSCDFLSVNVVSRYYKRNNALGFGLRWYLGQWFPDGDVRPLAVDGVPPTDASLRDGSYPLIVPLCLISCRPLDDDSRAFRDWLLGPEGRDLIRRAGYLPWDEKSDGNAGNGGDTAAHESRGSHGDNGDAEEER